MMTIKGVRKALFHSALPPCQTRSDSGMFHGRHAAAGHVLFVDLIAQCFSTEVERIIIFKLVS